MSTYGEGHVHTKTESCIFILDGVYQNGCHEGYGKDPSPQNQLSCRNKVRKYGLASYRAIRTSR